jgi:hypothetical protein
MRAFIMSFLAILACICFYKLNGDKKKFTKIIWILYTSIFIFLSVYIKAISIPRVWDFTFFYLSGKVAASGYDFYLPENFQIVFNSLNLPKLDYEGFVATVVNVGYPYPPPTILYVLPLGFLSYYPALILWAIFNFVFLIGSIYLVYILFFKRFKLNGLLLVTILFFLFLPVRDTIVFLQTNFILLCLILLMKKYSDTKIAGIFLAVAIFTKPYMIVFIVFFILRRNWNAILYFILSSIAIVCLTLVSFGTKPFVSYLINNPVKRFPKWLFSQQMNQSLHAVLLRANVISLDRPYIYTYLSIGILFATVLYLFYLLKRKLYDYIWGVLLLIGLTLYPGMLNYYGVVLLFIIFQFFDEKQQLGINMYLNISIVGISYYLSSVSMFSCICFLLGVVILKSLNSQGLNSTFYKTLQMPNLRIVRKIMIGIKLLN